MLQNVEPVWMWPSPKPGSHFIEISWALCLISLCVTQDPLQLLIFMAH